ncbi:hypothetical protein E8F20_02455 [Pseudomonas sp. BN415]|uniref:hypothetical protein n=1 Tax=Pseudomonas sp. BN415 TaxID=2567889 RepID=UPI0024565102|nr:hypothetical protein [Pseudomonas sp. BN415]MDH4580732.1 hypothetical protein [Pseudomonas sp. BN415]
MSLNRILILLVVAGYVVVNISMQIDFFAGRDIFAKYQATTSAADALIVAKQAYYAKTAFLLTLLILLALRVPFELGFGVSFVTYALLMLAFFGLERSTTIYLVASVALLGSYFWDRIRSRRGSKFDPNIST